MGVITSTSHNTFKSLSEVISKIKRNFKSYVDANLIDEGEFPVYAKEVLSQLGISAMKEDFDLIEITNYKAKLPFNFSELHAAWKLEDAHDDINSSVIPSTVVKNDVIYELVKPNKKINCCLTEGVMSRIIMTQTIESKTLTKNFRNPRLLRLSPNVQPNKLSENCLNLIPDCSDEITIDDRNLYTNFKGTVYLQFYGLAYDEDGYPMIPDIMQIEKAVEWKIKYETLSNLWYNNEVQDLEKKVAEAHNEYEKWMGEARYICKLPSFAEMVNAIRKMRTTNKVAFFSQQDYKRF